MISPMTIVLPSKAGLWPSLSSYEAITYRDSSHPIASQGDSAELERRPRLPRLPLKEHRCDETPEKHRNAMVA